MTNNNIVELKNLFNSINMHDEAEHIEAITANKKELAEYVTYWQNLRQDAEQAEKTTTGDTMKMYRHKKETLIKILEIIYLYA